jgi:hypothetical protein
MTVGYSIGKGDLDLALGELATSTRDMVTRGQQVLNVLQGLPTTQLANMGYSPADITLIQNTQTDIQTLIGVIQGTTTLATAHNFLSNLSQMYGAK